MRTRPARWGQAQVELERQGTFVHLMSDNLTRDQLLTIAAAYDPRPAQAACNAQAAARCRRDASRGAGISHRHRPHVSRTGPALSCPHAYRPRLALSRFARKASRWRSLLRLRRPSSARPHWREAVGKSGAGKECRPSGERSDGCGRGEKWTAIAAGGRSGGADGPVAVKLQQVVRRGD